MKSLDSEEEKKPLCVAFSLQRHKVFKTNSWFLPLHPRSHPVALPLASLQELQHWKRRQILQKCPPYPLPDPHKDPPHWRVPLCRGPQVPTSRYSRLKRPVSHSLWSPPPWCQRGLVESGWVQLEKRASRGSTLVEEAQFSSCSCPPSPRFVSTLPHLLRPASAGQPAARLTNQSAPFPSSPLIGRILGSPALFSHMHLFAASFDCRGILEMDFFEANS